MEFPKVVVFLFFMMAAFGSSMATTFQLGWIPNRDYDKWASSKNFQVGDSIAFSYNPQQHNVLLVTSQDFQTCSATNPMATYTSGSDSVSITAPGDYYFICGVPGHCQNGLKLHISVGQNPSNPISNPSPQMPSGGGNLPFGNVNPNNSSPGVYWTYSGSSILTSKSLTTFGAWIGIFLASYFCGFAF